MQTFNGIEVTGSLCPSKWPNSVNTPELISTDSCQGKIFQYQSTKLANSCALLSHLSTVS